MKLGFVGVGNIGLPICQNLIKNGHEVHVHDVAPAALERARAAGARTADSPAAVARAAETVFTCLPGPRRSKLWRSGRRCCPGRTARFGAGRSHN